MVAGSSPSLLSRIRAWEANIIDMVRLATTTRGPRGDKDDENDINADMEKDDGT